VACGVVNISALPSPLALRQRQAVYCGGASVRRLEPPAVQRLDTAAYDSSGPQHIPIPLPPRPLSRLRPLPRPRDCPPLSPLVPHLPPPTPHPHPAAGYRSPLPLPPPLSEVRAGASSGICARHRALPPLRPLGRLPHFPSLFL
ncbi:hypothetical protein B0H10DRAFT_1880180, partial [Mycena sp. CBHHK59/15]